MISPIKKNKNKKKNIEIMAQCERIESDFPQQKQKQQLKIVFLDFLYCLRKKYEINKILENKNTANRMQLSSNTHIIICIRAGI